MNRIAQPQTQKVQLQREGNNNNDNNACNVSALIRSNISVVCSDIIQKFKSP